MVQWKVPTIYFLTAQYCCRNPIISHYILVHPIQHLLYKQYTSHFHLFFMEKRRNKHPLSSVAVPLPSPAVCGRQIRGEQRRRRGGQRL